VWLAGGRRRGGWLGVRSAAAGKGDYRWWVHLGLIVSAALSLVFEPVLAIHIGLGLLFAALVAVHLGQRRRVSANLVARLLPSPSLSGRADRMAVADLLLFTVAVGMLGSGLWDWIGGHPTRVRWHAITGVVLAGLLVIHSVRRRARLVRSQVR